MLKEYDVLYRGRNCGGWEYVGKVTLIQIHKTMILKCSDCEILHVAATGSLSKEEKREIATRHGV